MKATGGPTIAIIGGGFGGVGAAIRLKAAGMHRITILERAKGMGGTWWHNTYPGAEVDTFSVLYSYSYRPWTWSRTHVRQAELQDYIAQVADEYDVTSSIRFGVDVDRVVWDEDRQDYAIYSGDDLIMRAHFVISAVGMLSDPKYPDWPGLDDFEGPKFHTSKWEHQHDLSGKRVAIVGSGSTATQVVPAIAGTAAQVDMFQREPGWIVRKKGREYTAREKQALGNRWAQFINRKWMLYERERAQIGTAIFRPGTPENQAAEAAARSFINSTLESRPDLIEAVTPKHPYGGKRPIISDEFYPALLRDNVALIPKAVTRVTKNGVVDTDGVEHPADVLVMSTGFKVQFLSTLTVVGEGGKDLHETWGDDTRAFLGIMMPGFPNFFMLYGPNTNGGAIVSNLELQCDYVVAAIKYVRRHRAASVDVKTWALEAYDGIIQDRLKGTSFEYENNYFKSKSGRITTQWPDGVITYGVLTKLLRGAVWKLGYRDRSAK